MNKYNLTPEQIDDLNKNIGSFTLNEWAARFDIPPQALYNKLVKSRLHVLLKKEDSPQKKWTPQAEKFLLENYKAMSVVQLRKTLHKTSNAIYKKASELGIEKQKVAKNMALTFAIDKDTKEWLMQYDNYSAVIRLAFDCLRKTSDNTYLDALKQLKKQ